MPYITISENVWVELDDFTDEDLIEELKERDAVKKTKSYDGLRSGEQIVNEIYDLKCRGQNYEHLVDEMIYNVLGRIC